MFFENPFYLFSSRFLRFDTLPSSEVGPPFPYHRALDTCCGIARPSILLTGTATAFFSEHGHDFTLDILVTYFFYLFSLSWWGQRSSTHVRRHTPRPAASCNRGDRRNPPSRRVSKPGATQGHSPVPFLARGVLATQIILFLFLMFFVSSGRPGSFAGARSLEDVVYAVRRVD